MIVEMTDKTLCRIMENMLLKLMRMRFYGTGNYFFRR